MSMEYHARIQRMRNAPKIAFVRTISISVDNNNILERQVTDHQIYISEVDLLNAARQLLIDKTGRAWEHYNTSKPMFGDGKHQTYIFYDSENRTGVITIGYVPMPDYEFYEHYEREQITDRISVPES